MSRLALGDRVAAGFVGAVIGAVIGAAVAWWLGVYHNVLPVADLKPVFVRWILGSAFGFGLVGLLFGPVVGSVLGWVITALFRAEDPRYTSFPTWVTVLLVLGIAFFYWQFG